MEDKNCSTCLSEDNSNTEWPCNQCKPGLFNNWSPKELRDGDEDYDVYHFV